MPSGVTSIGGRAFMGCAALEAVSLPDSLTTIATGAFSGTALEVLNLPADVDTVGANAFPRGHPADDPGQQHDGRRHGDGHL